MSVACTVGVLSGLAEENDRVAGEATKLLTDTPNDIRAQLRNTATVRAGSFDGWRAALSVYEVGPRRRNSQHEAAAELSAPVDLLCPVLVPWLLPWV